MLQRRGDELNHLVRLKIGFINFQQPKRVLKRVVIWAAAFQYTRREMDHLRCVAKEKEALVVKLTQGEFGFPIERRRIIWDVGKIIAGATVGGTDLERR